MKIIILNKESSNEYEMNSSSIVIGRSKDCDIVIHSENISRKHLEIKKKNEKLFIRDLTSSNWVSYNGERIDKEMDVELYDFMDIKLPDNYSLKLENEEEIIPVNEEQSKELESTKVSASNLNYGKLTKIKTIKEESSNKKKFLLVSFVIIIGIIIFIQQDFTIAPTSSISKPTKNTTARVQRPVDNSYKKLSKEQAESIEDIKQKSYELLNPQKICRGNKINKYCEIFFEKRNNKEGIVTAGENKLLVSLSQDRIKVSNLKKLKVEKDLAYRTLLMLKILSPKVLEMLQKDKITNIEIILIDSIGIPKYVFKITDINEIEFDILRYQIIEQELNKFGNFTPLLSQYGRFIYGKEVK